MNRLISYSIIFGISLFLFSCTDNKIYKIGVSQCSQDDWRMKMNDEIEREIMFHEDAAVEIRSADDNLKVSVSVKYLDNKSKMTQISQYELVLHKDDNWKIVE